MPAWEAGNSHPWENTVTLDTNLDTGAVRAALCALGETPGVGLRTVNRIYAVLGGNAARWLALAGRSAVNILSAVPALNPVQAQALAACLPERLADAARRMEAARAAGLTPVCRADDAYPDTLSESLGVDAPPLLYLRGEPSLAARLSGAVVGTRAPSPRGLACAAACAEVLANAGAVVVSGGAAGVDTAAHDAALACGGATVAVLPLGLLEACPPAHWREALDSGRLLLVSECPPNARWQTHAAVARNRIIAALARLVCVIEPRKVGGSIQTARHGLAGGRPVFCVGAVDLPAGMDRELRALPKRRPALETALRAALEASETNSGATDRLC